MQSKACARYVRIAPRKSRLVIDMIRGKNAAESAVILQFSTREASEAVLKVLNSAVANAAHKGASGADNLLVAEAYVDEGPILKRWRPRAQGRASRINKRTSHITLVLNEIEKTEEKTAKATKTVKAAKTEKAAPVKAEKQAAKADKKETKKPEKKVAKGEIATSPKKRAPRNDESKAKITETKAKDAVSKEDTSGSES